MATRPSRAPLMPPQICCRSHPRVALGGQGARQLLKVQVLVQLQALPGQQKEGRLADVQDRIADSLEELEHEQIGDDEGGFDVGFPQPAQGFGQRVPVASVQVELTAAGVLGLVGVGIGE